MEESNDIGELRKLVEAHGIKLDAMRVQNIAQHDELIAVLTRLNATAQKQLDIAEGYQELIAEPLKKGMYAVGVIKAVMAYTVGLLLMIWGVREIFDYYFVPRAKQ